MDKAKRLLLLKEVIRKRREQEALLFGMTTPDATDIKEETSSMESVREEERSRSADKINSDE